jgi:hypothetical protein
MEHGKKDPPVLVFGSRNLPTAAPKIGTHVLLALRELICERWREVGEREEREGGSYLQQGKRRSGRGRSLKPRSEPLRCRRQREHGEDRDPVNNMDPEDVGHRSPRVQGIKGGGQQKLGQVELTAALVS